MASSVEGQCDGEASTTAEKSTDATNNNDLGETAAATVTSANADPSATKSRDGDVVNEKSIVKKVADTTIPGPKETNKSTSKIKPKKIKVHLVAVGSAPILKKSKFLMNDDDRFAVAIEFLRKVLKLSSSGGTAAASTSTSSLFLYVNAAFVPSPDERMGDLYDCFGVRGELVIHYSLQEAWG